MPKTPDEIKKGLELCISGIYEDCCRCAYHEPGNGDCVTDVKRDALAYIQQLQATVSEKEKVIAELSGEIGRLEAERDVAVNDLHYLVNHPLSAGPCYACLHKNDCFPGGECDPVKNDHWKWRGISKEGC